MAADRHKNESLAAPHLTVVLACRVWFVDFREGIFTRGPWVVDRTLEQSRARAADRVRMSVPMYLRNYACIVLLRL